jgi:hypothetical protein
MQKLRYGVLAAGALFGLLVAIRAIAGPLSFPVSVRTPINIESFCGALLTAGLLLLSTGKSSKSLETPGRQWWPSVFLLLLVAAGFWRALGIYYLADDFVLVTRANAFHMAKIPELLTTAEASAFFRPVIHLTMAVTAQWAHFNPLLWRLNAVVLHAVNSALVFFLGTRLGLSRSSALFAGALFAIHGSLPESVVWIAGWFGVLSTFFVLCALIFYLEHLTSKTQARLWYGAASFGSMLLALLSKETAYAFPLIAMLLAWDRRVAPRRAAPLLGAFFAGTLATFAYRWSLLGGIGGYADLTGGGPLLMKLALVPVLRSLLLRLWAVLYFPINWSREPELWLGALTLVYVPALLYLASSGRNGASVWFSAGFVLLAALPPLEQLLIGPDLQKSRELYLPLAGFCLLLASAADRSTTPVRWIVTAVILGVNVAALQHNITIWQDVATTAQRTCQVASRCSIGGNLSVRGLPGSLDGVYFLGVGFPECVGLQSDSVPPQVKLNGDQPSDITWDALERELRCDRGR